MSYVVSIVRLDSRGCQTPILRDEWLNQIETDPELRLESDTEKAIVAELKRKIKDPVFLSYSACADGEIMASSPDDGTLQKMQNIAKAMNATVLGEEGESLIDDFVRRGGCFSIILLATFILTGVASSAWATDATRPNVLWICADDLAAYTLGCYGNAQARTPNIDRLAACGVRFDRAHCNSPVCTASRQSFLTGRYPRTIGVTQLKTALPESETTLAETLASAGYRTAAVGKMHFNSKLTHGFELRLDMPDYQQALKKRGKQSLGEGVRVQPPWKPFKDPASVWLNSECLPIGITDADMSGTWFAQQAADDLKHSSGEPFFLMVSFYEPHSPFVFPVEYRGRREPGSFAVPAIEPQDDWQIPAIFRDLTPAQKQGIMAAYYTSAEFLDKNVGLVLDALRANGHDRDTLVVLTGDHGYMLGQHGRFEKHCSFEPAVRAPLVIRLPGEAAGRHSDALVEFIDIVPTILDACHVPVPPAVQGRSLSPLLNGEVSRHREQVVVEYSENEEAMIRDERYKLVYITGRRQREDGYLPAKPLDHRVIQLFDEQDDPDELSDLSGRPEQAARIDTLLHQLADHLRRTARRPKRLPGSDDLYTFIDACLAPDDVGQ